MIRKRFSLLQTIIEDITFGLVRMYVTPYCFSRTIFILGFVGIPMGTNCAPFVAVLFLFCFERDFMKDLSSDNRQTLLRHSTQRIDI